MPGKSYGIRENSFFALLSHLIRLSANFVLFVGIARYCGPDILGQFTTALTVATIFLLLADFGFDILLSSEVARARDRAPALLQAYLPAKLMFAVLASLLMAAAAGFDNVSPSTRTLVYIFCPYVFFGALMNFFLAFFKGSEQLHHETKITFVANVLLLGASLLVGIFHYDFLWIAVAFVVSRAIGLGLAARTAFRICPDLRFRFVLPDRSSFPFIALFGLHAIFSSLFFIQDTLLLSLWKGDHDVGIYQSAFRLIGVILVIPDVAISAFLPVLSRSYEKDPGAWAKTAYFMNKTLLLIGLPIAVILFVYAEQIVGILYDSTVYSAAAPVLRVFSFVVLFHFAAISYAVMLTSVLRQKSRLLIVAAATVVNFTLNLNLIPRFGPLGAAFASAATILLVGIGYVWSMRATGPRWLGDTHQVLPVLGAILIASILWPIREFNLWLVGPLALVLLGAMVYLLGYTAEERRAMLRRRSLTLSSELS
jgi:O-antigen/teichoic acid export membrane protein